MERINPHSKNPDHKIEVWIPKIIYPDFIIPKNNEFIECKGYIKDKQWFDLIKYMSKEDKLRYHVIFKNPDLLTPWVNITYGDWCTMNNVSWAKHPEAKQEWFTSKDE